MQHALLAESPDLSPTTPGEMGVLLVEQHALVRTALRALLEATPGLTVVAEARDWPMALERAGALQPDVVLVDERTLERADQATLPALRRVAPLACILVLSDEGPGETGHARGAHGCLPASAGVRELCAAVAALLDGRCSSCVLRPHCPVSAVATTLSRRERQVAIRVAGGLASKQIAAELGISLRTVHTYRESLARKLGASSAAVVTRFVIETGLTESIAAR